MKRPSQVQSPESYSAHTNLVLNVFSTYSNPIRAPIVRMETIA